MWETIVETSEKGRSGKRASRKMRNVGTGGPRWFVKKELETIEEGDKPQNGHLDVPPEVTERDRQLCGRRLEYAKKQLGPDDQAVKDKMLPTYDFNKLRVWFGNSAKATKVRTEGQGVARNANTVTPTTSRPPSPSRSTWHTRRGGR